MGRHRAATHVGSKLGMLMERESGGVQEGVSSHLVGFSFSDSDKRGNVTGANDTGGNVRGGRPGPMFEDPLRLELEGRDAEEIVGVGEEVDG